ncbi:MAG: hypothetical protein ACR2ND_13715 [Solirubrobacteraceae bacterium]
MSNVRTHLPTRRSLAGAVLAAGLMLLPGYSLASAQAAPNVLRVGTFQGIPGQYSSIQAAVSAAHTGDWVLIAPGDYHEATHTFPAGGLGDDRASSAVQVTTPGIHIRGLDRNGVVLDGTRPGAPQCSSAHADQDFGPLDSNSKPGGRNGLVVYKADGVTVENLTACNFLTGDQGGGDAVWFDGGGASGTQALGAWRGSYLSASASFYEQGGSSFANYGIYASNTTGPGYFDHDYASNMADAAYYVGACPDCNTTLDHVQGEYSALGYSGTNSGGHLQVMNSEFDNNQAGFVTNSQNNDDVPSPQDGSCPAGGTGPTGTHSCWLFEHNYVHDNNNPNVPSSGTAAAAPVGTGVVIAGGRNDIVSGNRIERNNAWGVLLVPFPDTGPPPPLANCAGGINTSLPGFNAVCFFDDFGNEIAGNTFSDNGSYGNVGNGDIVDISNPENPGNCIHDNTRADGSAPTTEPPGLQATHAICGVPNLGDPLASPAGAQAVCDTQLLAPCPDTPQTHYPRATNIQLAPLPPQETMPSPCYGVPANPWCATASGPATASGSGAAAAKPTARKRCTSRRTLRLHLRRLRGGRIKSARVLVAGRSARRVGASKLRGTRPSLFIDLRGLRRGRVRVRVIERVRVGRHVRTLRISRVYRTCTKRA